MLSNFKSLMAPAAGVTLMIALGLSATGCGTDEESRTEKTTVRRTAQSRPVAKTAPRSAPDTTAMMVAMRRPIVQPEEVVVPEPEPANEVTYEEAEAAFHERRYTTAVKLFTQYTERKSENPWGYYMLGLSAWKAEDHQSAETALEKALELDPGHVKSWINLSRVLLDLRRSKDALAKIDAALAIDPESNIAYRLKGRALRQMGEKNHAVQAYRRAIQIDGQDSWSMNNLALIYIEEKRFGEALPALARAIEIDGDNPVYLNNLGMNLEGIGHFRAAEDAYRSATEADASYGKASTNLTRVEAVLEDPGIEPVDLESIARGFVGEIESWTVTIADLEPGGSVEAPTDIMVASEVDSTETVHEP